MPILQTVRRFLRRLVLLTGLCLPFTAVNGADDPPVDSPEILIDHRVTFRIAAPLADTVKLQGIQRGAIPLKKDADGVWSVTIGPLLPGIYSYSFLVDGEMTVDPENPDIKPEREPDTSVLEISTNTPLFYQWKDVPHGTVGLHDYLSKPLKRLRRLRVYTPPGYEESPTRRYPVLYLFHGTGDTEATWTEFGRAHYIMDNLLNMQKAEPMIIVMTDGHADLSDEEGIGKKNLDEFEADLLQAVVPYVDAHCRTQADAGHRAISGLSMGGIQALYTGLRHPELFSWVCGMSAWVPDVEKCCAAALEKPDEPTRRLLWLRIGRDDPYLPDFQKFDTALEKHALKRDFALTDGDHSWPVWRQYLQDLAPKLFRE